MHLDRTTRRILGSLIEKRFSTPDQYPLTMNALVLACNQRSNRDPFLDLEEFEVQGCVLGLRQNEFLTVVERDYGRSLRYKERLCEALALGDEDAAVLAELLLRGPQTEQELARRCPRMVPSVATPEAALAVLRNLAARGLTEHLPREPGQRHARWAHRLTPPDEAAHVRSGETGPEPVAAREGADAPAAAMHVSLPAVQSLHGSDPIAALRRDVEDLRAEVARLRDAVTALGG